MTKSLGSLKVPHDPRTLVCKLKNVALCHGTHRTNFTGQSLQKMLGVSRPQEDGSFQEVAEPDHTHSSGGRSSSCALSTRFWEPKFLLVTGFQCRSLPIENRSHALYSSTPGREVRQDRTICKVNLGFISDGEEGRWGQECLVSSFVHWQWESLVLVVYWFFHSSFPFFPLPSLPFPPSHLPSFFL